ncbi:MAG: TolC family outer membrane protein [Magnetococcales bacterium]|nr:TolC family outer membrane protein [Magnetococcales bacterium]
MNITQLRRLFLTGIAVVFLLASGSLSAASFQDLITTTLQKNPTIRAAQQRLEGAQERDAQSFAALMPQLSLNAYAAHSETDWATGDSSATPAEISLEVSQVLFNKQALTAYDQRTPYISAFEQDLSAARQGVIFNLIDAATKVLEAGEMADLSANNETLTERHLKATEARYQVGEITRTNVSQAISRLSSATADRIQAENSLASSRARFFEITGMNPPDDLTVPDPVQDITGLHVEALLDRLSVRPDLQAASLRVRVAEMTAKIQYEEHYPVVSLAGEVSRGWNNTSGLADPVDGMSVTISASLPLYSGGMTESQTREAQANHRAQVSELSRLQRQAQREVKQAQLNFQSSEAAVTAYESVVDAGKAALEGVEQEFQVGTRTALEVLDAQHELFSAKVQLTRNRYNRLLARYELLRAMGLLDTTAIEAK